MYLVKFLFIQYMQETPAGHLQDMENTPYPADDVWNGINIGIPSHPWSQIQYLLYFCHIDRLLRIKYIRIILNTLLLLEEIWQNQRDTPGSAGSVWRAEAV